MGAEIHKNDIGTVFKCTVYDQDDNVVNISTATTKEIIFLKQSEETLTVDAEFYTDGSDGILTYTTVSGDLDEASLWKIQVHLTMPNGEWRSNIDRFDVINNIS